MSCFIECVDNINIEYNKHNHDQHQLDIGKRSK
jgi:hypothetical protein